MNPRIGGPHPWACGCNRCLDRRRESQKFQARMIEVVITSKQGASANHDPGDEDVQR